MTQTASTTPILYPAAERSGAAIAGGSKLASAVRKPPGSAPESRSEAASDAGAAYAFLAYLAQQLHVVAPEDASEDGDLVLAGSTIDPAGVPVPSAARAAGETDPQAWFGSRLLAGHDRRGTELYGVEAQAAQAGSRQAVDQNAPSLPSGVANGPLSWNMPLVSDGRRVPHTFAPADGAHAGASGEFEQSLVSARNTEAWDGQAVPLGQRSTPIGATHADGGLPPFEPAQWTTAAAGGLLGDEPARSQDPAPSDHAVNLLVPASSTASLSAAGFGDAAQATEDGSLDAPTAGDVDAMPLPFRIRLQSEQKLSLHLNTDDLGPIRVEFSHETGLLELDIKAARSGTAELLSAHLAELANGLRRRHLDVGQLLLSPWDDPEQPLQRDDRSDPQYGAPFFDDHNATPQRHDRGDRNHDALALRPSSGSGAGLSGALAPEGQPQATRPWERRTLNVRV